MMHRAAVVIALALGASDCARTSQSGAAAGARDSAVHDRTVFTDTALFRRLCVEADSGLSPAIGRCTPRDQSRLPIRRP